MTHITSFINDDVLTGGFLDGTTTTTTGEGLFGTSTAFVTATGETITTQERFDRLLSGFSTTTSTFDPLGDIQKFFDSLLSGLTAPVINQSEQIAVSQENLAKEIEAIKNQIIFQATETEQKSTGTEVVDKLKAALSSFTETVGIEQSTGIIIAGVLFGVLLLKR